MGISRKIVDEINLISFHGDISHLDDTRSLSIIMPVFNQLEYTKNIIEQVKNNIIITSYEFIIIDDGSTDGTSQYLQSLKSKNIKILKHKKNEGVTRSWNDGINACDGDYILVINNDIEILTRGFEKILMSYLDEKNLIACPITEEDGYFRYKKDNIAGRCWMITKDLRKKIGPIDERIKIRFNDDYILRKAMSLGGKAVYIDGAYIRHFGSKTVKAQESGEKISDLIVQDKIQRKNICKDNYREVYNEHLF